MNRGKLVFAQLVQHLPLTTFVVASQVRILAGPLFREEDYSVGRPT
jgi:hypothetical protein